MKTLLSILLCCFTSLGFSQVTSVDYLMKYNCDTDQYDVSIVILEGSASTVPQRAQFNAQISIVVPTGEFVALTDLYMPLQNNQSYSGNVPLKWTVGTPIIAPQSQPENDFYGITPTLSPASFYNDLEVGIVVKLFSFTAGTSGQYDENVRFFINDVDPGSTSSGMGGGNFRNNFTMGSSMDLYHENIEESCSTTSVENDLLENINVYPNPFQDQITIESLNAHSKVSVLGSDGKVLFQSYDKPEGKLTINTSTFSRGVYYIRTENDNGIAVQKVVKF